MPDLDRLPAKKDVASALMLKGTVFVHLDPRADDVIVPQWLKRQPQLVLQVGLDMHVPIPDLRVDDCGVFGTLSFNRTPFTCSVPWEAVFAIVGDDGRGMVWPGSMPEEIAAEVAREARRAGVRDLPVRDSDAPARRASDRERQDAPPEPLADETIDFSEYAPSRTSPNRPIDDRDRPSDRPALCVIPGQGGSPLAARPSSRRPPYLRVVK